LPEQVDWLRSRKVGDADGDWSGNGTDGILWFNASTGDTDE
jgi:hypothetical protein